MRNLHSLVKKGYFIIAASICLHGASVSALTETTFVQNEVDNAGNLISAWVFTSDFSNYVVQASTGTFGGSWSTPTTISATNQVATSLCLKANDNGDAVAVWTAIDSSVNLTGVYGSIYTSSSQTWSSYTKISSDTEEVLGDYRVRIDDLGNIGLIYTAFQDSGSGSRTANFSEATVSGGSWSTPIQISP